MRAGDRRRRTAVVALVFGILVTAVPMARADLYDEPVLELADVVVVDANGEATFRFPLKAGQEYLFVAEGRYSYGPAGDGDAECTNGPGDPIFRRERYPNDVGDLTLNGYAHDWQPVGPTPEGCSASHTYTFSGTPATTEWTRVNIKDTFAGDNSGRLVVAMYRVDCRNDVGRCLPAVPPLPGIPGLPPMPPIPSPPPVPPVPSVPPGLPELPPDPPTIPTIPTLPTLPPPPSVPTPPSLPPNPLVSTQASETLTVDAADANGTTAKQVFQAGRTYEFVVSGRYRFNSGGSMADAECSQAPSDPTYQRSRVAEPGLDLVLNGYGFDWTAMSQQPCDASGSYHLTIEASGTGLVELKVSDTTYTDNQGQLTVTVLTRPLVAAVPNPGTAPGELIETLVVDSRDPLGVYTLRPLAVGRTYQFVSTGAWFTGSSVADTECVTSPGGVSAGGAEFELTVNDSDVAWIPSRSIAGPCDEAAHLYRWTVTVTAPGGYPLLRIRDTTGPFGHLDNAGIAVVTIYEVA